MKKILFLVLAFALCHAKELSLQKVSDISYECSNQCGTAKAVYYNLSDNSLSFVKLELNGKSYTFPALVSGSGVRYTMEMNFTWWVKGDEATLYKRDDNGEWKEQCVCKVNKITAIPKAATGS